MLSNMTLASVKQRTCLYHFQFEAKNRGCGLFLWAGVKGGHSNVYVVSMDIMHCLNGMCMSGYILES
jgi:hypothetical protein